MGVAVKNPDGLCGRWTTLGLVSPGDARALRVELGRERGELAQQAAAALSPFCDPQRRGLTRFWLGGWTPKLQVASASEEQVRAEWRLVEALLAHKDLILALAHRLGMDRRRGHDTRRVPSAILFEEGAFDGAPLSRVPKDALSRIAGVTFEELNPHANVRRGRAFALWANQANQSVSALTPAVELQGGKGEVLYPPTLSVATAVATMSTEVDATRVQGFVDRKGHLQGVAHARLYESAAQAAAFVQAHPSWFSGASGVAVMELSLEVEALEVEHSSIEPEPLLRELAVREREALVQVVHDGASGGGAAGERTLAANEERLECEQIDQLCDELGILKGHSSHSIVPGRDREANAIEKLRDERLTHKAMPALANLEAQGLANRHGLHAQMAWAVWGRARSREQQAVSGQGPLSEGFFNTACEPGPLSAAALSFTPQLAQEKWSGQAVAIARVKVCVKRLAAWAKTPNGVKPGKSMSTCEAAQRSTERLDPMPACSSSHVSCAVSKQGNGVAVRDISSVAMPLGMDSRTGIQSQEENPIASRAATARRL